MITNTRRLQFSAGHRVYKHESKCAHLHGHNYVVYLTAMNEGGYLDDLGRVIDFGVLKDKFGSWIEANWDHGFIVFREDLTALRAVSFVPGQKVFLLDRNPTAENLAAYFIDTLGPQLLKGTGVVLTYVVIEETENCRAEAWGPGLLDAIRQRDFLLASR